LNIARVDRSYTTSDQSAIVTIGIAFPPSPKKEKCYLTHEIWSVDSHDSH